MEPSKMPNQTIISKLQRVLSSAEEARELEDRIHTDRDGELLPDPVDESGRDIHSDQKFIRRSRQ